MISIIGLIGLVSLVIESRAKEMSIIKVLGAGVSQIIYPLSKEFMIMVMVASVLAVPLAWYFGNEWLQHFAYRSPLGAGNFLLVILMSLLLTLGIVGLQALRAAYRNTVSGLRSE